MSTDIYKGFINIKNVGLVPVANWLAGSMENRYRVATTKLPLRGGTMIKYRRSKRDPNAPFENMIAADTTGITVASRDGGKTWARGGFTPYQNQTSHSRAKSGNDMFFWSGGAWKFRLRDTTWLRVVTSITDEAGMLRPNKVFTSYRFSQGSSTNGIAWESTTDRFIWFCNDSSQSSWSQRSFNAALNAGGYTTTFTLLDASCFGTAVAILGHMGTTFRPVMVCCPNITLASPVWTVTPVMTTATAAPSAGFVRLSSAVNGIIVFNANDGTNRTRIRTTTNLFTAMAEPTHTVNALAALTISQVHHVANNQWWMIDTAGYMYSTFNGTAWATNAVIPLLTTYTATAVTADTMCNAHGNFVVIAGHTRGEIIQGVLAPATGTFTWKTICITMNGTITRVFQNATEQQMTLVITKTPQHEDGWGTNISYWKTRDAGLSWFEVAPPVSMPDARWIGNVGDPETANNRFIVGDLQAAPHMLYNDTFQGTPANTTALPNTTAPLRDTYMQLGDSSVAYVHTTATPVVVRLNAFDQQWTSLPGTTFPGGVFAYTNTYCACGISASSWVLAGRRSRVGSSPLEYLAFITRTDNNGSTYTSVLPENVALAMAALTPTPVTQIYGIMTDGENYMFGSPAEGIFFTKTPTTGWRQYRIPPKWIVPAAFNGAWLYDHNTETGTFVLAQTTGYVATRDFERFVYRWNGGTTNIAALTLTDNPGELLTLTSTSGQLTRQENIFDTSDEYSMVLDSSNIENEWS